ncbi:prepilin-type N-terminal cleavage/methylation domain-containing protein [Planctomycetota bacterium]
MIIKNEKKGWVCCVRRIHAGGHGAPCPNMRCGFTLAEAMMAIVVLGIASAGLMLPFSSGARLRSEGMHRTLGAKLASHLMEQILHTPFDQIMDYDGYTEPEGQVKNAAGETFSDLNYAKFSRETSCNYVYVSQESGTTEPVFIRVTVRVSWNGDKVATINRLVSQ